MLRALAGALVLDGGAVVTARLAACGFREHVTPPGLREDLEAQISALKLTITMLREQAALHEAERIAVWRERRETQRTAAGVHALPRATR